MALHTQETDYYRSERKSSRNVASPDYRKEQRNNVESSLKLSRRRVFHVYNDLIPDDIEESIEKNNHHGWSHLYRVFRHSLENATQSVEVVQLPDLLAKFAPAIALAERFHDIIQQHLNHLGFEKDSKTFHAELGALYIQLISPILKERGFSDLEIHFASVFTYFHSEPERITDTPTIPDTDSLVAWLQKELEVKRQAGKKLPGSLEDFFPAEPEFQTIIKSQLEKLEYKSPVLSADESKNVAFFARRFAIADKLDALDPADYSNLRTSETKADRSFYKKINSEVAEKIFSENIGYLRKKIEKATSTEKVGLEKQLAEFLEIQQNVHLVFAAGVELPIELEVQLRLMSGEIMAEDDLSRIMYEACRNYDDLKPTSFERKKIARLLQSRLDHVRDEIVPQLSQDKSLFVDKLFEKRLESLAQAGLENSPVYLAVMKEHSHFKEHVLPNKEINAGDVARINALILEASKRITMLAAPEVVYRKAEERRYDPVTTLEQVRVQIIPNYIQ